MTKTKEKKSKKAKRLELAKTAWRYGDPGRFIPRASIRSSVSPYVFYMAPGSLAMSLHNHNGQEVDFTKLETSPGGWNYLGPKGELIGPFTTEKKAVLKFKKHARKLLKGTKIQEPKFRGAAQEGNVEGPENVLGAMAARLRNLMTGGNCGDPECEACNSQAIDYDALPGDTEVRERIMRRIKTEPDADANAIVAEETQRWMEEMAAKEGAPKKKGKKIVAEDEDDFDDDDDDSDEDDSDEDDSDIEEDDDDDLDDDEEGRKKSFIVVDDPAIPAQAETVAAR